MNVGMIHYLKPIYYGIVTRCHNKNSPDYKNYGARGVTVHSEWLGDWRLFRDWVLTNLGERPTGYSIDRINNDGNYEPGNLRWASSREQASNKRMNSKNLVIYNGETMTQAECARRIGVTRQNINAMSKNRYYNKYSIVFVRPK